MCTLPHNWDEQKPDYTGDAWYRLNIPRPAAGSEPQALWLVASMNASVMINGVFLGSGGRMDEPVARHWNRYLLFTIPDAMLKQELNDVVIRVYGYANNSSGLLKLYLAPASQLGGIHYTMMMRSNLLTYGSLIVTLLIGLLAGIAALVGRNRTTACFALGCLASVPYLLDTMIVHIPFSREIWERGAHISIVCSEMFFIMFIFRVLEFERRWITYGLVMYGVIGALLIVLADEQWLIPVASVWEGLSLIMLFIACMTCLRFWFKEGAHVALVVSLALFAVMVSFAHDWIPWVLRWGVAPPFTFYLGPSGFVVAMAALLISRFITDYHQESALTLSLRQKVRDQDELLSRKQASIMQLWTDQAVRDERDRIVRELHDGVGGMLSNALALVDSDSPVRSRLQRSIDELRLVMGAIDEGADIASLLGTLRPKLNAEVEESGGALKWELEDIPPGIPDNATTGMHLVRIVQECIHNALRHGRATEIRVYMDVSCLRIEDNGSGFNVEHVTLGRGLKNMRWRAEQLGGEFALSSSDEGTTISICWGKMM